MKILTDPAAARAVVPRPAATTLVVRDGEAGLEVLMVRRSPNASFMPGAYVFPGGAVDAADGAADAAALCDEPAAALAARIGAVTETGSAAQGFAVAALRECFEECGLWLHGAGVARPASEVLPALPALPALRARLHAGAPLATLTREAGLPLCTSALQPWSHWVTPLGLPKRFDTLFFVAVAPPAQQPSVDEGETTTLAWVHPPAALAAHARGEFPMEFATVQTVASLAPFSVQGAGQAAAEGAAQGAAQAAVQGAAALCAHAARQRHLPPLHPRLQVGENGERVAILLPGQAGYDSVALQ